MTVPTEIIWIISIGTLTLTAVIVFLIAFLVHPNNNYEDGFYKEKVEYYSDSADAKFEVVDLVVTPSQVKEGEPVTVLIQVVNNGDIPDKYDLNLKLDGKIVAVREIELQPRDEGIATINISEKAPGEHTVEVEEIKSTFMIAPAEFAVSDLKVFPEIIKEGDSVNISVQVANIGGATGSYLAELKVKGAVEMVQHVRLSPGESQLVTFILSKKKTGFYPIEIGGHTSKLAVEMWDNFDDA